MFEEELRVRSFQFSDFTYLSYFSVNNIHQGGPSTGRESQHNKPRRSLKQKNEWIKACGNNLDMTRLETNSVEICWKHFKKSDFKLSRIDPEKKIFGKLKTNAVPSREILPLDFFDISDEIGNKGKSPHFDIKELMEEKSDKMAFKP